MRRVHWGQSTHTMESNESEIGENSSPSTIQIRQRALRVLILEDDAGCRELLRESLAKLGARVIHVEEAHCLAEFEKLIGAGAFDLCLVDLVLPDGLGIDMIHLARRQTPAPTVLVVSSLADEETVVQAILAGASGYVCKQDEPVGIANAITIAADGGSVISPSIAHHLMELLRKQPPPAPDTKDPGLTERESEILKLAAKGCNYRQIAEMTGTQPSTVYTHVRHIYEKLRVSNLQQALFEARLRRLV